jgi:hypothetical protein
MVLADFFSFSSISEIPERGELSEVGYRISTTWRVSGLRRAAVGFGDSLTIT